MHLFAQRRERELLTKKQKLCILLFNIGTPSETQGRKARV